MDSELFFPFGSLLINLAEVPIKHEVHNSQHQQALTCLLQSKLACSLLVDHLHDLANVFGYFLSCQFARLVQTE